MNLSIYESAGSARWFAGRRLLLMDVIENLPDDIRLGDCCDDAQLATALETVLNL
ncbi:MAG: hypothetical protein O7C39_05720 [Bacteroidetes bacterium]|nr:hypothetical protein [Bacteroidota bacterium]